MSLGSIKPRVAAQAAAPMNPLKKWPKDPPPGWTGNWPPSLQMEGAEFSMPAAPGTIILSKVEKEMLAKRGIKYKDGDPLPEGLLELDDRWKLAIEEAKKHGNDFDPKIFEGLVPGGLPPEIDIRTLDAERKKAIDAAMAQARIDSEKIKATQSMVSAMAGNAGVGQAFNVAMEGMTVINDLKPIKRTLGAVSPPPPPPPPDTQAEPEPQPVAEEAMSAGAGDTPADHCPHCNWNRNVPYETEATLEDKVKWVIALEGRQRFRKQYSIMGGRIMVTFRSLTATETDLAFRQVALDASDVVKNPELMDGYWRNLMIYKMCMGIEQVWTKTGGSVDNPEYSQWAGDPPFGKTKLYMMVGLITEELFPQDYMRRLIGEKFHEFGKLVEHLEAHGDDESFWAGIG